ncbi:DUF4893 domain-containing protein [Sphingomonas sp. 8AM]|uniref:DUF4893 domain-containing protein n=1 Tax=Sphingomonas sp. 8AM TaxID=2653170 RepID=UPI0012F432E9|nr:DUF4893 domain-containing protein [Sphingomonas sp. 8AM]VXC89532.1 conserved exported hypothetical protein [Sphingomonas sp. 8AM]
MRRVAGALLLCLAGLATQICGAAANPLAAAPDWRRLATPADRDRLRRWYEAWTQGLAQARPVAGADLAAQGALFAIDAALDDPAPPVGTYRCRTFKLGSKGAVGTGFVSYPWFDCRVAAVGEQLELMKLGGSQRQVGLLYRADPTRAAFLGTLLLGDESRAYGYGADATRNVAGWVERIGPHRWRLVMPYPAFESTIDVLELVPAG